MGILSHLPAGPPHQPADNPIVVSDSFRAPRFHAGLLGKEILAHIFTYASAPSAEHTGYVDKFSPFHIRASPMNLSHVCRRWRQLALSLPHLWTNIYMWDSLPRSPDLLWFWIQRSKSQPLRISLATIPFCPRSQRSDVCHHRDPCPTHYHRNVAEILSLLVKYSFRWEEVILSICLEGPTALYHLSKDSFPRLKTVAFRCSSYVEGLTPEDIAIGRKTYERFWDAVTSSPALKSLYSLGNLPLDVPLDRLQHLSFLYEPTEEDVWQVTQFKQLQSLEFSSPLPSLPYSHPIELPALRHFQLVDDGVFSVLTPFVMPSLESLHLIFEGVDSDSFPWRIHEFLSKSVRNLRELTLQCSSRWKEGTSINCLGKIGSNVDLGFSDPKLLLQVFADTSLAMLTSLTMEGSPCPPQLVDFLSKPNESSLPSLRRLSVHFPFSLRLCHFENMIEARRKSDVVQNLESVRLIISPMDNFWVENRSPEDVYEPPEPGATITRGDSVIELRPLRKKKVLLASRFDRQ